MTSDTSSTDTPAAAADSSTRPTSGAAPSPGRGVFVSFEGGDGAGKSTQIAVLAAALAGRTGREVITTREPGGTELGQTLRGALLHGGEVSPRAEALIYAADRAHHVATVIRPALARGAIVLTDRYLDSSVAYQAGGRTLPEAEIEQLSLWASEGLLPDLTVLLDLPPEVAATRRDGPEDRMERAGSDFHQRTRRAFLDRAAAAPGRWVTIDASQPIDTVSEQVRRAVDERFSTLMGSRL